MDYLCKVTVEGTELGNEKEVKRWVEVVWGACEETNQEGKVPWWKNGEEYLDPDLAMRMEMIYVAG